MAPIVAVLEMKPDAKPEIGSPKRGPTGDRETDPVALIPITRMTTIQIDADLRRYKVPVLHWAAMAEPPTSRRRRSERLYLSPVSTERIK